MIEIKKSYTITLSEEQAKQLYFLLGEFKDSGRLTTNDLYSDLRGVYEELKPYF